MKNCSIYKGQALAISMIVLVVCAILGVSIYSRVVKDRQLVLNEQISAEALEIADSVLDSLSTVPMQTLQTEITQGGGTVEKNGWVEVSSFLTELGLTSVQDLSVCKEGNSAVDILIEEASIDDLIEVRPDEAKSFRIEGKTVTAPCNLSVHLESRGTVNSGIVIKKIYGKNYTTAVEYKIYEETDITPYCFSDDMLTCNSNLFSPNNNWTKMRDGVVLNVNLAETKGGYSLDEVRIIPVGGVIGIGTEISPAGCMSDADLGAVRIVANVTCQDIYRAKEVFLPEDGAVSFSSVFDHTLYNNIGMLDL